jgi:tetratricopeptide (TPR) repeat protein
MSAAPSGRVFISYRRQESSGMAGRLYDRLAARFGDDQVFMDVDTIAPGVDFGNVIAQAVSTCEVLLAVIGPGWLTISDADGQRRLDDPDDIVRLEIAAALERDIRVIPLLVEGAAMPRREELPDSLARLARRNALSVRHESFRFDADRLLAAIEPVIGARVVPPASSTSGQGPPDATGPKQHADKPAEPALANQPASASPGTSGHPHAAAMAAYLRGDLLAKQEDVTGARTAYQLAIDSGDVDAAPLAALSLGVLLREQGDNAGARVAYQLAIDSNHHDAAPKAAYKLGELLTWSDVAGAQTALQLAIDSGHRDEAPQAAFRLGEMLAGRGDVAGARAAYQVAIDSDHPDVAPWATVGLGNLLADQGDIAGARAAYQQAIDFGEDNAAPWASYLLGGLLADQGDVTGARAAYQQAIDYDNPTFTSAAVEALRNLSTAVD